MARRERTTGLPRPAPRGSKRATETTRFGLSEHALRLVILGGAAFLLVLVLGIFAYRWYDDTFQRPNKVVLTVADEQFKLGYYTDRLLPWLQNSRDTSLAVAQRRLLEKLEEEGLTLVLARERGITISDDDITRAIADELGVPVGGAGSSFDRLYRQRLQTTGMSDSNYRRLVAAQVADTRIRDQLREEIGTTGETVMLRLVVVDTEEEATTVLGRIEAGEDMGSIAQVESTHVQSRQQDGLYTTPPVLLTEEVQEAIVGQEPGALIGPIESGGSFWVIRIERRDPEGTYTEAQIDQLVDLRFVELLEEARTRIPIERKLTDDDIRWAEDHLG
ncbi:MAG: hypothetical protein Kow0010_14030 [Dehalococcoidia bacterium]